MKILVFLLIFICSIARAENFALYNFSTAVMTASSGKDQVMPIASITKLFTAMTILESEVNLDEKVLVQGPNRGRFPWRSMVSRMELLKAMLIASDNRAADTLAMTYPGGMDKFLEDANLLIEQIGLTKTRIVDPSGLSADNVSTPEELVNFAWYLRRYPFILETSSKDHESVEFETIKKKHIKIPIKNTNPDINKYRILLSKTGFTNKAGRCILLLVEYQNNIYSLVILNSKTSQSRSETIKFVFPK